MTQAQEISGEADYEATMKEVGSTFAALQQNMDARDGAQVISDAAKLAELFARVQAFWEGRSEQVEGGGYRIKPGVL